MKKIFVIVFTFIQCFVFAQTDSSSVNSEKNVSITASGSGKTQDEAKQSALRSAIEQTFGAFISSKTEILNDQVVADQITSVTNGNIQSFEILNASQLPDGSWGVTLKASVSVSKLTSFVQAKGISIEIKGGMFALNIKQQLLNEQGEIKAVSEMVGLLHEPMQISFDYTIKSGDPKSLDAESKNWAIPLTVTATANKNMNFCANYCIKTLSALSLSAEEVQSYKALNKGIYPISINFKGTANKFYFRKQLSIKVLNELINNWEFYLKSFKIQTGMDETTFNQISSLTDSEHNYNVPKNEKESYLINVEKIMKEFGSLKYEYNDPTPYPKIDFLSNEQQAAIFKWNDIRTLQQIEQMTGYNIKPLGVTSKFGHGGYIVYEKDGHGLIAALVDLGAMEWEEAKEACRNLNLNGYNDWKLPSVDELLNIYNYFYNIGLYGFKGSEYWSSDSSTQFRYIAYSVSFYLGGAKKRDNDHGKLNFIAIRGF